MRIVLVEMICKETESSERKREGGELFLNSLALKSSRIFGGSFHLSKAIALIGSLLESIGDGEGGSKLQDCLD